MTYYIREKWYLSFNGMKDIEIHDEKTNPASNIRKDMKGVKEFIKDWLESWEVNARDGGHKFLGGETDFKTYASCKIRSKTSPL